jgi:hypothetical protein
MVLQAGRAQAQTAGPPVLGDAGHLAISGERLFGYAHTSETQKGGTLDSTFTSNTVSILGNPTGGIAGVFSFPRVGFDYFAARGFTVGASLSYFHISDNVNLSGSTVGASDGTISGFVLAPRLGFAARLSPTVSIWPRAGITYAHFSSDNGSSSVTGGRSTMSSHFVDLTIEAPLAIDLVPRVVLLIGPTLDLGLSGGTSGGATSTDLKETEFGVQVGFLFLI